MSFRTGLRIGGMLLAAASLVSLAQAQVGQKAGEKNTPPAKGERVMTKLKPGDPAPDFSLPTVRDGKEVKLSSFQGKKPVVLIFGSYT